MLTITCRGGTFIKDATYGTSTLDILLDDVKCNGDEANIGECIHSNWGDHNCDHTEDSSCRCEPPIATGIYYQFLQVLFLQFSKLQCVT